MGYRSLLRSVGATIREVERDAVRRQHQLEKQQIAYEKMQKLEKAKYEVEVYENYIERIITLHKDCRSNIDWKKIVNSKPPVTPEKTIQRELAARLSIEKYVPGFFDKIFRLENKRRKKLEEDLNNAVKGDNAENYELNKRYQNELKDYNELITMAQRMLNGDFDAYRETLKELEPLSEISEIGSEINYKFISKEKMSVTLFIHDSNIIPRQSMSLLKSGKLSVKEMPISKYNELYQDYVCSSSLRVARELFGLLPVEEIVVTSKAKLLNTVTGRIEFQPILSVRFIRETINSINFENIDPSDSMMNFVHHMGFRKNQGMQPVEELKNLSK